MSTIVTDLISHLQAGEAIALNDAVYIDSADGKIYKFDATDDTQVFAGIAKEAGVLNDYIRVVQSGRIKGFSGLTAGQFVYASTTTPGGFQLVEPAASQKIILGIAKSSTELTINGGLGIKPGGDGAGGGLDVYYIENMEGLADVSSLSTGNNAAFLGGGTLQGTLALESVSPISGTKSLSYTQAAGSLNDYFASELIDVEFKQQNNDSGMTFYFTYDGNDDDIKFVVYDVTNGAELTSGVELVKVEPTAKRYALSFYVPVTCNQIRWGAQVLVENIGAVLVMDDVEITSNPFVFKDLVDPRTVVRGAGNGGESITANVTDIPFTEIEDDFGLWDGDSFTAPSDGDYLIQGQIRFNAAVGAGARAYVNGSGNIYLGTMESPSTNLMFKGVVKLSAGDVLNIRSDSGATLSNDSFLHHIHIQKIPESTEHVITPAKSTLSDWTAFTPDIGGVTSDNIVYAKYRRVGDSLEIQAKFGGTPQASELQLPLPNSLVVGPDYSATIVGLADRGYAGEVQYATIATSGDTFLNIGRRDGGTDGIYTPQNANVVFSGAQLITMNATVKIQGWDSDATFLAAIPTPKTAYIKDVKPSGTAGGTFTAGAWQTRDLNTLEGDTGFVSLSSNQFTLQPGKYEIEARSVAYKVASHKMKIRNITEGVDAIIGMNAYAEPVDGVGNAVDGETSTVAEGTLVLTASQTFEVQHRGGLTQVSTGFGLANNFGVDEVYSTVKITRVG